MVRVIGLPLSFRIEENWGPSAFAMQSVTRAALNQNWYTELTHYAVWIEAHLWLVMILHYGGSTVLGGTLLCLFFQACSFRDRMLSPLLSLIWLSVGVKAVLMYVTNPYLVVYLGKLGLLSLAAWRWTAHFSTEKIPPGILSRSFTPIAQLDSPISLFPTLILGPVAEMAAGLPFQYFNFWAMAQLQKIGAKPTRLMTLCQVRQEARKVQETGTWAASTTTAYLVDPWIRTSKYNSDPRIMKGRATLFHRRFPFELCHWGEDCDAEEGPRQERSWMWTRRQLFGLEHFEEVTDRF